MGKRFKKNYPYPIRIKRKRENNTYKEARAWGGFIKSKYGYHIFRIRFNKWQWWRFKDMAKTPDLTYMDVADDMLYYEQLSPDDFIQMRVFYIPRQIEDFLGEFTIEKIKETYGDDVSNQIKENEEVEIKDKQGKTYVFKKGENTENISLIQKYEVRDVYHQPISAESKSYVAKSYRDYDEILKTKESGIMTLAKWALPFFIAGLILLIGMYIINN